MSSVPEQREPINAVLRDGRQVVLRPARAEDGPALATLYESLADPDVCLRFPGVGLPGQPISHAKPQHRARSAIR